jgi:DNA-binding NarL/FixJ family response regulator
MGPKKAIQIVLAEDHKIVRDGLRALINQEPDMQVAAEAEDGRAAVRLVRKLLPDVVVLDIVMPVLNGIEAARQIKAACPDVRIIALSMYSDTRFVTEMLKAGASAYLVKDCAFAELVDAVHAVVEARSYLSSQITGLVLDDYVRCQPQDGASAAEVLSPREREVLQLIAEGKGTREIADILCISVKTVETHRSNIMQKLKVRSVAELTKYAIREGLTSVD